MKLSRTDTLILLQERIRNGIYDKGSNLLGYRWNWGTFRGHDIRTLPAGYLYWHACNNDSLSLFHLQWLEQHFGVVNWSWPMWEPPSDHTATAQGHYNDSTGAGHYSGQTPVDTTPISEDLYWFRLGKKHTGTSIL